MYLRAVRQTVHGILLEWLTGADTSEEKGFTLSVASGSPQKEQVVHLSRCIHTYALDSFLPGIKYRACLSRGPAATPGRCVVFGTGRDRGGLGDRERLLHASAVLCAVLLAAPVGACIWAA